MRQGLRLAKNMGKTVAMLKLFFLYTLAAGEYDGKPHQHWVWSVLTARQCRTTKLRVYRMNKFPGRPPLLPGAAIVARCPACQTSLTHAADCLGYATPAAGQVSVCAYCCAVLVVLENGQRRFISLVEKNALLPAMREAIEATRQMVWARANAK